MRTRCDTLDPFTASRRGFTLVEVLVTIAIIGLLIGILAPALSYALARADDAACRSNLHQIAQCFRQYAASNRGYAPDEKPGVVWSELLRPYAPDDQVFRCPGDPSLSADDAGLSYFWRDLQEYPHTGIRRMHGARDDAVLVFDFASGWHRPLCYNVSLVNTSVHSYTSDQFDADVYRAAE